MDIRAMGSLKRPIKLDSYADGRPSKFRRILDGEAVGKLGAPGIVSYSRCADASMRNASMVPTFAPLSVAMHSLVSNDFTHQAIDQALRAELEGKIIRGILIDDFVQAAFPEAYRGVQQSPLNDRREGYFTAVNKYLRVTETATDRSQTYESFIFIVNYVVKTRYAPMEMISMEGCSVKGIVDRRVPACIVRIRGVDSPGDVTWDDVLVPFYFTAKSGDPQSTKGSEGSTPASGMGAVNIGKSSSAAKRKSTVKLEPHEFLAGYALEILSASGLRQHTIAVLVDNKAVSLWYFDRAGAISSTYMNLETENGREMFRTVLEAFALASRCELGYVRRLFPSAEWPTTESGGSLLLWNRDQKQQNCDLANLKKLNTGARGLVGRGTVVYSFGDDEKDPEAPYALKLSWQPVLRPPEVDFLLCAERHGVEGIPRVLAVDSLGNLMDGIRGHLPPSPGFEAEKTDRQLRALVFDQVCRPLNEFPIIERPLDFLKIFKQLITTHYELCRRALILHRDVSPNNLMWAPARSGGMRVQPFRRTKQQQQPSEETGYLIDLDFAASVAAGPVEHIGIDDISHTLALPFLALDHLPPDVMVAGQTPLAVPSGVHMYRHDLESFLWSAWWILLGAARDSNGATLIDTDDRFSKWMSNNLGENRRAKWGFLRDFETSSEVVTLRLWEQHKHRAIMQDFLNNMLQMFAQGYQALEAGDDYPTAGGHITFDNFMQLFPF